MWGNLWQRGYFDHIVRDEADEARIAEYIQANPSNWAVDPDNPRNPEGTKDESRRWSTAALRTTVRSRGGGGGGDRAPYGRVRVAPTSLRCGTDL